MSVDGRRSPSTTLAVVEIDEHDVVGGHLLVGDAAGLDGHDPPLAVDPADVAPGQLDQPVRGQGQIGGQDTGRGDPRSTASGRPPARSDLLVVELEQLGHPAPATGVLAEVGHEVVGTAAGASQSSMNGSIPASGRKWK